MSRTRKIVIAIALLVAPAVMTGCADVAGPSESTAPSFDSRCTESQGVVC
jgi:hypothetical protein